MPRRLYEIDYTVITIGGLRVFKRAFGMYYKSTVKEGYCVSYESSSFTVSLVVMCVCKVLQLAATSLASMLMCDHALMQSRHNMITQWHVQTYSKIKMAKPLCNDFPCQQAGYQLYSKSACDIIKGSWA